MLTATPLNWIAWDFDISEGDREVAVIDHWWLGDRASITLNDERYDALRVSSYGPFVLGSGDRMIASAVKLSPFTRALDIEWGGGRLSMQSSGVFSWGFDVFRDELRVGRIDRVSFFSRKAEIDLPEDISLVVQIFIFWLVLTRWRRPLDAAT